MNQRTPPSTRAVFALAVVAAVGGGCKDSPAPSPTNDTGAQGADVTVDTGPAPVDVPVDLGVDARETSVDAGPPDAPPDAPEMDVAMDTPPEDVGVDVPEQDVAPECRTVTRSPGAPLAMGDPPRPISPLSTARVGTRTPTLRWQLPPGATGATVELCRDHGCATVARRFDAMGTSSPVPMELAAGVWHWRVFARTGATTGTRPSATWTFRARPRGTRGGVWGLGSDFDADGFEDFVVRDRLTDTTWVFYGSSNLASGRMQDLSCAGLPAGPAFDVDGDGYGDRVMGSTLWFGGPTGIRPGAGTGTTVTGDGALDVDGDGYGDIISSANVGSVGMPTRLAFTVNRGSRGGVLEARTLHERAVGPRLTGFRGVGDVDVDGFADLGWSLGATEDFSEVEAFRGSAALNDTTVRLATGTQPSGSLFPLGDSDGDGAADFLASVHNDLDGAVSGPYRCGRFRFADSCAPIATTLAVTSSAGDVNGDGYDDLYSATTGEGLLGPGFTARFTVSPEAQPVGDVDNDGFDDLVRVLVPASGPAEVQIYRGNTGAMFGAPVVRVLR